MTSESDFRCVKLPEPHFANDACRFEEMVMSITGPAIRRIRYLTNENEPPKTSRPKPMQSQK